MVKLWSSVRFEPLTLSHEKFKVYFAERGSDVNNASPAVKSHEFRSNDSPSKIVVTASFERCLFIASMSWKSFRVLPLRMRIVEGWIWRPITSTD